MISRKEHWENIYANKQPHEVSWTQDYPKLSLDLIHKLDLPKTAEIIDIGGGDSKLVDNLLQEGYQNLSVLDISEKALERTKRRLDQKADMVNWIVSDITAFRPARQYDCWHDRAAFHFLTKEDEVEKYLAITKQAVKQYMIIGTFSDRGPEKCSMLDVHRYTEADLRARFAESFEMVGCTTDDHTTPFNTRQNFIFCTFKRKDAR